MQTAEIVRVKDVIIEKISANDKELSRIFGLSERSCADRRREMSKLPSQIKALRDGGAIVTIKGFDEYLQYRGTREWKHEMDKFKKMTAKKEIQHG